MRAISWIGLACVFARTAADGYGPPMEKLIFDGADQDGWARYGLADTPDAVVAARFSPDPDGYLRVTALMVLGDPAVTAGLMRQVPIARMEAGINAPGADVIRRTLLADPEEGVEWDKALAGFRATRQRKEKRRKAPAHSPADLRLPRPDGQDPGAFYERVAAVYAAAVQRSSKPAVDIADASDVPVATVRRWILEARRRGHIVRASASRRGQ